MVKTGKRRSRKGAKKRKERKERKVYTGKRTWNIVMRINPALRSLRSLASLRERLQIPPLRCGMTQ